MATVTNFANAFETTLTADMLGTDLTAQVQTTDGAPASPCYLVIDPHNEEKREYALFDGTFGANSFVTTALANRYLDGSAAASGITHAAGAIVRFAPVAQHFRNIQNSAVWLDEAQTITGAKTFSTAADFATANIDAMRAKNSPWFDVTHPDYGAVGDGVVDDTAAIQAAIDATQPDGGTVYFPARAICKISSPLTVGTTQQYVRLKGAPGARIHNVNDTQPAIILGDSTGATAGAHRATLETLRVTASGTGTVDQHGIVVGLINDGPRLIDVRVGDPGLGAKSGGGGDALRLVDSISGRVDLCTFDFAGQDGISVQVPASGGGANATIIRETTSRQNGRHGFHLAAPGAGASATYHLRILGGVHESNAQRGMLFSGSPVNAEVDGPQIESNGAASQINGGLITLRNMSFLTYGWDVLASGTYTFERCLLQNTSPLSIAATVKGVTLRDCVLESTASLVDNGVGTVLDGVRFLGGNNYTPQEPPLWIGADDLLATGSPSAPTHGRAGSRFNSWLLDAAAFEQVQTTFPVPEGWVSANFDLYWSNAGAGTGNVLLGAIHSEAADGGDLTTGDTATYGPTALAAPAENVLEVTRIGSSLALVGGRLAHIRIWRDGAAAGDTLTNDIHLIGLRITRAA